ncbi:MAG TPA: hypothetical protein DG754_05095 [Bacteroidales bacterium]|mgnify:CR=1 FL=1|jgi:hypothetical protein|nr:hypothetical protein [Bacteroidales bacterium]
MYLFLDIRVEGIKDNFILPYTGVELIDAKIKEIAWLLIGKNGKTIERKHFIAYRDGFVESREYQYYKDFPDDKSLDSPCDFSFIFSVLMEKALDSCELIIMNNVLLKDALIIDRLKFGSGTVYLSKRRLCIDEELLVVFSKKWNEESIVLTETYDTLYSTNIPEKINLLSSLKTVSKCFIKLVKHNYIHLKTCVKYHSVPIYLNQLIAPNIKSITSTRYFIKEGVNNSVKYRNEITNKYTDFGNIVLIKHFNKNNKLTAWEKYHYEYGLLKRVSINNSKDGQMFLYKYNYQDNGLLSTIDRYDRNGDSLGHINFHYNSNNELIGEFICKPDDSFVDTKYRYNGLGTVSKVRCHYFFEKNYHKEYVKINEFGKPYSYSRYKAIEGKPYGILIRKEYKYKENLLVECVTNKTAYDYNLNSTTNYKFSYDCNMHGDWITREHTIDGALTQTTIREIEYYN